MRALPVVVSGVVLALCATTAVAETVRGRVLDRKTGEPVEGAAVFITGGDGFETTVATDDDGRYAITVTPGKYRLTFLHADARVEGQIAVVAGADTTLDARLKMKIDETIVIEHTRTPKVLPKPKNAFTAIKQPPYSDRAIEQDAWVRAWLLLDVDETGTVTRLKFLNKPGYDLEPLAVAEGFKLAFEPARGDRNEPVRTLLVWGIEWPSRYWLIHHAEAVTRMPDTFTPSNVSAAAAVPCKGSGPWKFNKQRSAYKGYRDCTRPDLSKVNGGEWILRPE